MIRVQTDDFIVQDEYDRLCTSTNSGAVVTFVGRVRDFACTEGKVQSTFELCHYPGMTESVLEKIVQDAKARWPLHQCTVIHRFGTFDINGQIVFVGVSSAHRSAAFEACHYIIDILKTQAPFWKKEGPNWVEAKDTDQEQSDRWLS